MPFNWTRHLDAMWPLTHVGETETVVHTPFNIGSPVLHCVPRLELWMNGQLSEECIKSVCPCKFCRKPRPCKSGCSQCSGGGKDHPLCCSYYAWQWQCVCLFKASSHCSMQCTALPSNVFVQSIRQACIWPCTNQDHTPHTMQRPEFQMQRNWSIGAHIRVNHMWRHCQ